MCVKKLQVSRKPLSCLGVAFIVRFEGEGDRAVLCAEHWRFPSNRFMIGTGKTGLNSACSKYIAERFIQCARKSVFLSEWSDVSEYTFSLRTAALSLSLLFSPPGVFLLFPFLVVIQH